jgi:O-antigen biosynthesis protein
VKNIDKRSLTRLTNIAEGVGTSSFVALTDDPSFLISGAERLRGRRVMVRVKIKCDMMIRTRAALYFDCGEGFSERNKTERSFRSDGTAYWVWDVPQNLIALRMDPLAQPGTFEIVNFSIEPISNIETVFRGIVSLASNSNTRIREKLPFAYRLWKSEGIAGLALRAKRLVGTPEGEVESDYARWIRLYEPDPSSLTRLRSESERWEYRPVISLIMPTFNSPETWLCEAIGSILAQTYGNWELCIADDASTQPQVRRVLEEYQKRDSRIKVTLRTENGHISAASNSALTLARGEWVALMDHDDTLPAHALHCVVKTILENPNAMLIYSDEDKISEDGVRSAPYFKPDWNCDLFYSHNLISHLGVYKREVVLKIGGFRLGFEGSQDYDLALRYLEETNFQGITHIPRVLYHWRVHSESTSLSPETKPYAMIAGERAINEHLVRTQKRGAVALERYGYVPKYRLPSRPISVCLIVPTKDAHLLVKQCLDSIETTNTYPHVEILIVDNQSSDVQALNFFSSLEKRKENIRVIQYDKPFNFSGINNFAVKHTDAEVICFINNDVQFETRNWLIEMLSHAMRDEIGAVGIKLLYPDRRIQHAGIVAGIGKLAAHSHRLHGENEAGYIGRAALVSNFSAVTGACLMVRRKSFLQAGMFDEEHLPIAYNDVDLCFKLLENGLRNIYLANVVAVHHESATRGAEDTPEKLERLASEQTYMLGRWGKYIENDPAYSPNLTLENENFEIAFPPRVIRL